MEPDTEHWTNKDGTKYAVVYPIVFGVLYALTVIALLLIAWAFGLMP